MENRSKVRKAPPPRPAKSGARETSSPFDSIDGGARTAPIIHEEVYERLRRAIIAGQLEPGRSLSVRGLASEFGVSAMPAREAIRRLVALGALELTQTRRVSVAQMTPEKFDELSIARCALEPPLAALVLRKKAKDARGLDALAAKLKTIDAALDDAISRGDVADYGRSNSDFHFALYEAAEAPVLLGLVESLWLQIGPFMRVVIGRLGTSSLVDHHKEAIEALEAGDAGRLEEAIRLDLEQGMSSIARAVSDDAQESTRSERKRARR